VPLTDTHCHLDLETFDGDRDAAIRRAQEKGVVRILIPGLTPTSSQAVVKLAQSHPILYAAVGIHPNEASTWVDKESLGILHHLALNPKVVAIGEIGLDYYWNATSDANQQEMLKDQLDLAGEIGLPVILHTREKNEGVSGKCAGDLLKILEDWVGWLRSTHNKLAQHPGVLHSFSGSLEDAQRAIQLGFYIGVTGPVTYKNAEERRRMIVNLPIERLLIETDSPFLAPQPHRGERNEPAFVSYIADKIAQIQTRTPQEVASATAANAAQLFSWGE
jgi:TatD DNase family protein